MAANTKIQWATHTFNPWRGCTKIAPGCANCYAEAQSKRNPATLGVWGPSGTRVVASEAMWRQPLKWDREAAKTGERPRVFCASLADVFEDWGGDVVNHRGERLHMRGGVMATADQCGNVIGTRPANLADVRVRLFGLIDTTPNLNWLLLTKRPENVRRMIPWADNGASEASSAFHAWQRRDNVWLGVSIACRADLRLLDELRKCRDMCAKTFVSAEPLIEDLGTIDLTGIDWVIVGGESGPNARPCHVDWLRSIVRQCRDAGVPPFVKQAGAVCEITGERGTAWPHDPESWGRYDEQSDRWFATWRDKKGGDPAEWAEDLRVREVPT